MEYRCISADCHIDLRWLPYDLFVSNATAAMKDRMPYVTQDTAGPMWVTKSGVKLALANGKGSSGALGGGNGNLGTSYVAGEQYRRDRIAATGLWDDAVQGKFRPTTPHLRLQDQDRDGIQAEVIYGLLGAGKKMEDREAAVELYRIYNEWLAAFCRHDPRRFVGLASIPSHNVEVAIAETHRAAKLGLGGLDISASYDMVPLWDPYWDPFWKTAADVNLAVHFHTIGPPPMAPVREDLPENFKYAASATKAAGFQLYLAHILAAVIHSGALERFPNLRIVLGESGIGWIPYVLQRMDAVYKERFKHFLSHLKMQPSEYWHRQCRATFQDDYVGAKLLDELGVENVMWGSDYPHSDGVFPDSQEYIQRQFSHLPEATQHKITCGNVGKFYGLIPD